MAEPAPETTTRPDPGLARGRWEAPAWAFYGVIGAIVVGGALYLLWRGGVFKRRRPIEPSPTSKRGKP